MSRNSFILVLMWVICSPASICSLKSLAIASISAVQVVVSGYYMGVIRVSRSSAFSIRALLISYKPTSSSLYVVNGVAPWLSKNFSATLAVILATLSYPIVEDGDGVIIAHVMKS